MALPKIKSKKFTFKLLGDITVKQLTVGQMMKLQAIEDETELMYAVVKTATTIKTPEALPASTLKELGDIVNYAMSN